MAAIVDLHFGNWVPEAAKVFLKERFDAHFADALRELDDREALIDVLRRLASDFRMKTAYTSLGSQINDEAQWYEYFQASLFALIDFDEARNVLKEAHQLKADISRTARNLERLLAKLYELVGEDVEYRRDGELDCPDGLFELGKLCIRSEIDTEKKLDRLDEAILADAGLSFSSIVPKKERKPSKRPSSSRSRKKTKFGEDQFNALLWSSKIAQAKYHIAPKAKDVAGMIANAADEWTPAYAGELEVAIASRKRNKKLEYIKAFLWNLRSRPFLKMEETSSFYRAVAITADVVLNDPDDSPSVADVRRVVAEIARAERNIRAKK